MSDDFKQWIMQKKPAHIVLTEEMCKKHNQPRWANKQTRRYLLGCDKCYKEEGEEQMKKLAADVRNRWDNKDADVVKVGELPK